MFFFLGRMNAHVALNLYLYFPHNFSDIQNPFIRKTLPKFVFSQNIDY